MSGALKDQQQTLFQELSRYLNENESKSLNNISRRVLYSKAQLLIMDLEDILEKQPELNTELNSVIDDLKNISDKLKIVPLKTKKGIFPLLDSLFRFAGAGSFVMFSATFLALPAIVLKPLDDLLFKLRILKPWMKISTLLKRFVGHVINIAAGIQLKVQGLKKKDGKNIFGKDSSIICFSHGSTLDVFSLAESTPVFHTSLGKNDLFFIPFFSWLLIAFGCVPVDRNDRNQAICALSRAAASATGSDAGDCIAIAPEGTRSKTGHLSTFKKGPFHIYEQLQIPIVPTVIIGAFDIWPPSSFMPRPGRAYVRYLEPILPGSAGDREATSRAVRRAMLTSLAEDTPSDLEQDVDLSLRLRCYVYNALILASNYWVYRGLRAFFQYYHFSTLQSVSATLLSPVIITLGLYGYMNLSVRLAGGKTTSKSEKKE